MGMRIQKRVNRVLRKVLATEPEPHVEWEKIVRIEATGCDVLGAFEVSLTFQYSDGRSCELYVHHKGYDAILDELLIRFPKISPDWHSEMAREPWHVERTLYSA